MVSDMKELWVVRHTAVEVPQGVCYGGTDVDLKPTFMEEAMEVKKKLKEYHPDLVLSSPLSRAIRLAKAVGYEDAPIDERLREQHFGNWEMKRYDEINDPQLKRWYQDYVNEIPTNGESFRQVVERIGNLIEEIRTTPYQRILVFAHGGIQMAVGAYLSLYTLEEAPNHFEGYGSVLKYKL